MNMPTKDEWEKLADLVSDIITDNPDEATDLYRLMTIARAIADGRLVVCDASQSLAITPATIVYAPATTIPEAT